MQPVSIPTGPDSCVLGTCADRVDPATSGETADAVEIRLSSPPAGTRLVQFPRADWLAASAHLAAR
jgi:hypothetical protein